MLHSPHKRHLGHGVYAETEHDTIKLTTINNQTTTNTIILNEQVINALTHYWEEIITTTNQQLTPPIQKPEKYSTGETLLNYYKRTHPLE